jgi:hypothetical protein
VARLVPRPSSRNERPGPAAAPRPDSHLDDEPSDSGIPWLLQLISGLALILGLWLATPGGGSLALVNSAYEGGKKISAEHAEAVLVGLAETNAVRLRQGLAASVDPFDNMPGVQQVYVVDPSRRILVPESEKGIPLEGAERYLEKPIRFEGKTLGYIELAYDPGVLVHRSWSPLLHGILSLIVLAANQDFGAEDTALELAGSLAFAAFETIVLGRVLLVALLEERNYVLARNIRKAAFGAKPDGTIVAVLGMAHLNGVAALLESSRIV